MITYSIIIPHKNSPKLLNRCVNSIPRRNDVEIIVVDDNSNSSVVDWDNFHFDNNECITLIKDKTNKGAGHARNVGIDNAHGKWLLFADADDTYIKGFLSVLDRYKDTNYDVIYYNFVVKGDSKLMNIHQKGFSLQQDIITKNSNPDFVRFRINVPWIKMVSSQYVHSKNICFEEIVRGNDVQFTYLIGYCSHNFLIIPDKLYTYYLNSKSTTWGKWKFEKITCSILLNKKINSFLTYIGHKEWCENTMIYLLRMAKHHPEYVLHLLIYLITQLNVIKKESKRYIEMCNKRTNKTK